jgi:NAD(P)-dependent dehydrogenase (short-subunit alcohol dehydrogenase family)
MTSVEETAMAFGKSSTAMEVISGHDLTGKETIVTGGASGLGVETARALASAGARVVLAGRDPVKGEAAAVRLREETGNDLIVFRPLDLGSLESVTTWARKHVATGKPLHILINNAGIMATPLSRTDDGFESQFGTNHLGHFAFTTGLLPSLRAAGTARVVSLSSRAHRLEDARAGRGHLDLGRRRPRARRPGREVPRQLCHRHTVDQGRGPAERPLPAIRPGHRPCRTALGAV